MQDAVDFARKYLEDLLTFFGLNVSINSELDDDVIELSIPSTNLNGFLIGEHGGNLRALQHIVSIALLSKKYPARVNIDIADYKKQRAQRLADQVRQWAETVKKTSNPMELAPMNGADRRTVHQAIAAIDGVETESVGDGHGRHVVIKPAQNS
jgi:spoIIIJ-associated protein